MQREAPPSMTSSTAAEDLSDDLQSMSFGSSDRSISDTSASALSTASSFDGRICIGKRSRSGEKITMTDLRFVRKLGSGDIGSVYLAEVRRSSSAAACGVESGVLLAAKVMDKRELAARDKLGRARAEREILEDLDHPFLPRMYGSAEDGRWSVLLTEFCPGGDLHVLRQLQPFKRFDEASVRGSDNEATLANIVARALEFPKDPKISVAAKDLIGGLLAKDPERRIGWTTGATAIKRHPFFAGVSWALLRCASPPYVPPPLNAVDFMNDVSDDSGPSTSVDVY
ncbi:Serine/threonine-protein kinase AtPK7 [Acorus calamus]|uniref:non-specific serine/threonine protein kinase n=1 Tax=Acorus calamus TaxID=4465 RepID=A0AAV9CHW6_ACOCL|nr:Serine/threonine-protein kinase AtPK7 [Acorus calamus]